MRFVLVSLLVLGASGCAKHGVDTVKEIRARACAGDAAGVFSHIDREEFSRSTRDIFEKRAEASFTKLDPAEQAAAREKFKKNVDGAVQARVDDTFAAWEHDIKTRGPESELCHLTIVESREAGNTADVHVRTPATGDRQWRMIRSRDRWLLARVGD
jgi:hypothetical protein